MTSRSSGWVRLAGEIFSDLAGVARSHLLLARQEAGDQWKVALRSAIMILAGLVVAHVTLLLLVSAAALLVGRWLDSLPLGILVVATPLLVVALALLIPAVNRLRRLRPLAETFAELGESQRWLQEDLFPRVRENVKD